MARCWRGSTTGDAGGKSNSLCSDSFAWFWIGALVSPHLPANAADAPADDFYVIKGDHAEIAAKVAIRFLVHDGADYLPRSGDLREIQFQKGVFRSVKLRAPAEVSSLAETASIFEHLLLFSGSCQRDHDRG